MFSIRHWKYIFVKKDSLAYRIKLITGFYPNNLRLYKQAFTHKSVAKHNAKGKAIDNERLEYLGDAVLDTILADFLFKKFPYEDEGVLTQLRSKVVNRKQLSHLASVIGLDGLIHMDGRRKNAYSSIYGNAFEAFIGAIYLDKGFKKTYKYVVKDILHNHINICQLKATEDNYKSVLLEWAQKTGKEVTYKTTENPHKENAFISLVVVDHKEFETAMGHSKKEAEQNASFIAVKHFGLLES